MQHLPSPWDGRGHGPVLAGALFELSPEVVPVPPIVEQPVVEQPVLEARADVEGDFIKILRANLHAAGQHASMGHEGRNFRECQQAACRDAAMMVPPLEGVEVGATDAELDAVLDRVLAALKTNPPEPVPARMRIQGSL